MKTGYRSVEAQDRTEAKPSIEHIHTLIEEAFWGSLQRIEGGHHRFSIAVCEKTSVDEPFIFKKELKFNSVTLAKLSPALDAERTLIGVWPDVNDKLSVWGLFATEDSYGTGGRISRASRLSMKS